jgi:membrane protease YdiL (CAAX protease family)
MRIRTWIFFGFTLFFPLVAALFYFVFFAGSAWMRPTYIVAKVVQFSFPLVYSHWIARRSISVRAPERRALLIGLLLGVILGAVILGAYYGYYSRQEWMQQVAQEVWIKITEIGVETPLRFLGLALFLSIVHALLEEYYWRWFTYTELSRLLSAWLSALITNVAFTLHHIVVLAVYVPAMYFWPHGVLFSLGVLVGGIIWSLLYRYTGSIYSAWCSHAVVDLALMYIGYDLCRGYWR